MFSRLAVWIRATFIRKMAEPALEHKPALIVYDCPFTNSLSRIKTDAFSTLASFNMLCGLGGMTETRTPHLGVCSVDGGVSNNETKSREGEVCWG